MILFKFLNKAYTKYNRENVAWKNALFHAMIVLLIFLLFQPFGFRDKDVQLKLWLFPGYALIAFLYNLSKFYVIRRILTTKKGWTLKNELVSFLVTIVLLVLIIHLYSYWITGDMPLNMHWYLKLLYYTTSFLMSAYVIEYLYYSNKSAGIRIEYLSAQIQQYSQMAKAQYEDARETIPITLEKGRIAINRSQLVFIESNGNYLDFYIHKEDGEIKILTKRGRLHQVEADLEKYMEFIRCHRAFMVNLKKARQMKGNSKKARLVFDNRLKEIPVSRTCFKALTQKLESVTIT